ncbi:MAG: tRNA(Ile)-lysidine synthase [Bacteroidetes bacterium]|nr:tRNA(Ile)-lysidine synthase [Bacteroidota bacterium]
MSDLDVKFEEYVRKQGLANPGQSILVAVSGGVDSMVLLDLFARIRRPWKLRIALAHVNHGLREVESDGDEEFVRMKAAHYDLPFYRTKVDTLSFASQERLTKQEAARELRYAFFEETRKTIGADVVATAHQANDNVETILLNLVRGTGLRGLAGIPVKRDNIIRPLLFAYRANIEEYAKEHSIDFRTDSSNSSLEYKRNLMRLQIIPSMESVFGPDILPSINRVSSTVRQFAASLETQVHERYELMVKSSGNGDVQVSLPLLHSEPSFMQEEIVLSLLRKLKLEASTKKVGAIIALGESITGSRLDLGKGHAIYRDRERLLVTKETQTHIQQQTLGFGQHCELGMFRFSVGMPEPVPSILHRTFAHAFVDANKLEPPLLLRGWRSGDWFMPLGLPHKKKLSDFFIDEKVPLREKHAIPVFESHGNIVWVCGKRVDDRFKVTAQTRSVVRLEYSRGQE